MSNLKNDPIETTDVTASRLVILKSLLKSDNRIVSLELANFKLPLFGNGLLSEK